ncbi:PP2C family protein-serine/threonine phosphatase [Frankia sp. R82]|uniref:PP2C family protein-serine/threonine phosphatase n=1 Tax=Frankia sp. R82 TaxID=2950553 RepID=UPI0020442AB0|nr:PP2C family protein-serine/threonine phosphatase [Frankia sp. R82]MCM3882327.1 serine/threonine-protein phosphatase [Frankia sp. R82]
MIGAHAHPGAGPAQLRAWWRCEPVPGCAGGDWVDVVALPRGALAVTIGDAAGHDGQARALAAVLRSAIRRELLRGLDPGDVLARALTEIAALSDMGEMFATAFVAVVDPITGRVRYASAGHPAPVFMPDEDGRAKGCGSAQVLPGGGPVLSDLFAGRNLWPTRSTTLAVGDRLALFTDGITEARDQHGTQFGMSPLLAHRLRALPPEQIVPALFAEVGAYSPGRPRDDQAVIVLARVAARPARPTAPAVGHAVVVPGPARPAARRGAQVFVPAGATRRYGMGGGGTPGDPGLVALTNVHGTVPR